MSFTVNSEWEIERGVPPTEDGNPNTEKYIIKITSSNGQFFEAVYTHTAASVFSGEIQQREKKVLALKQYNSGTNGYAFHIANDISDSPETYEGFFRDNNGSIESYFKLTKL